MADDLAELEAAWNREREMWRTVCAAKFPSAGETDVRQLATALLLLLSLPDGSMLVEAARHLHDELGRRGIRVPVSAGPTIAPVSDKGGGP